MERKTLDVTVVRDHSLFALQCGNVPLISPFPETGRENAIQEQRRKF
jgi:hypothetical protein